MKKTVITGLVGFLALVQTSAASSSCPEALQNAHTDFLPEGVGSLCELHDRYESAAAKLWRKGRFQSERISDVLAPRFINMKDWIDGVERTAYNPWLIYNPAPKTWGAWEKGRKIVDKQARKNFRRGEIEPLDLEWVQKVHRSALDGLNPERGQFRTIDVGGQALTEKSALTPEQVAALSDPEYMTPLQPGKAMIRWRPLECKTPETPMIGKSPNPKSVPADSFFVASDGQLKQCGRFLYTTTPDEVEPTLNLWLEQVNSLTRTWGSRYPENDIVLVAAQAQRWYVAIHPFRDGNGRTSRFMSDLLLESMGLPTPVLDDMNLDTVVTEKQWAVEVGKGMLNHVEILEKCAKSPKSPGCNRVRRKAPRLVEAEKIIP